MLDEKSLLEKIIHKISKGELKIVHERTGTKFIYMELMNVFTGLKVLHDKCNILYIGDGQYEITLVGTFNGTHEITKKFWTWKDGAHKGFGDTIIALGWNGLPYVSMDNNGEDIVIADKSLISEFISPTRKYENRRKKNKNRK